MSYTRPRKLVARYAARRGSSRAGGGFRASMGDDSDTAYWQGVCSDPVNYDSLAYGIACKTMFPDGVPHVSATDTGCLGMANQATSGFQAKIDDIAKNWNPPDTYDAGQIRGIVTAVMGAVAQAQRMVDQVGSEPNAQQSDLNQATDDLTRVGHQSLDYIQAANDADAQGVRAISAPGMKHWVLVALTNAMTSMETAYVVACQRPWWVGALAAFTTAFDTVWGVVKSVVGIAITIGEKVIKATEAGIDLITWIETYGPYVAVGLGALWIVTRHKRKPRRSRS